MELDDLDLIVDHLEVHQKVMTKKGARLVVFLNNSKFVSQEVLNETPIRATSFF
jgi:hypothetical protein